MEKTVKVNGSEMNDFSIDYVNGKITVNNLSIDDTVNIDYKGWSYPVTDVSLSNSDGGQYEEYQIDNVSYRYLDIFQPAVVYVNSSAANKSEYSIDPFSGVVKFNTALTDTDVVTMDASYVKIIEIGTLFSWELNLGSEKVDGGSFREEYQKEVPLYPTFDGSIEGYHIGPYFVQYIDSDFKAYVVKFWLNYADYYIGWVHMDITISSSKDDLIKESINFTGYRNLERLSQ
jgi:hypothetical protein